MLVVCDLDRERPTQHPASLVPVLSASSTRLREILQHTQACKPQHREVCISTGGCAAGCLGRNHTHTHMHLLADTHIHTCTCQHTYVHTPVPHPPG